MLTEKRFRSDIYYRLNVFPVLIPPLRERPEAIPVLVRYLAQKYSRLRKKQIRSVPAEVIAALQKYYWPGKHSRIENIIELGHILKVLKETKWVVGGL